MGQRSGVVGVKLYGIYILRDGGGGGGGRGMDGMDEKDDGR